jgi:hypothetical protein
MKRGPLYALSPDSLHDRRFDTMRSLLLSCSHRTMFTIAPLRRGSTRAQVPYREAGPGERSIPKLHQSS